MKLLFKTILLLVLSFCLQATEAQKNLVPNGSFEDTIANPLGGVIEDALGWINSGGTPDYYNPGFAHYGNGFGTPNCFYSGYQIPKYGNSFAGLGLTAIPEQPAEFIAVQLTQPMVVGTKYCVSAYISQCEQYPCATNNFCFKFCNSFKYSASNPPVLDNFAHIRSTAVISDTLGWNLVGGSFIADSAYQYLIIGNFFNLFQTDTIHCTASDLSCYYIDNVCVSSDSIICLIPTSIANSDVQINELKIHPNPASDFLNIEFEDNKTHQISIYNSMGEIVLAFPVNKQSTISIAALSQGVYYLKEDDYPTIKKFIIY